MKYVNVNLRQFEKFLNFLNELWFYIIASVLFWPILCCSLLICVIMRLFINAILKIQIGQQYGGLLRPEDSFLSRYGVDRPILGLIMIFKSEQEMNMINYIKKILQEKIFNRPFDDYKKLNSTYHERFGYPYYLKNNYSVDECVREIPLSNKPISEEYLRQFTGNFINSTFPKNDAAIWDVLVSESHLEKAENEEYFRYAVIIRFSHLIGDGTSLTGFLTNTFSTSQFPIKDYNNEIFNKAKPDAELRTTIKQFVYKFINVIGLCLYLLTIWPGSSFSQVFGKGYQSPVHGPANSADAYVAWPSTSTNFNYISKIKRTKRRMPGTKFSDIVFASVSMSLSQYFKRQPYIPPEYNNIFVPTILHYPKPDYTKPARLLNKSSIYYIKLYTGEPLSPLQTLEKIISETKKVSEYSVLANRFFLSKIVGNYPKNVRTLLFPLRFSTMVVTSVPGCSDVQLTDTLSVEKLIPICPLLGSMGIAAATVSYGDEFVMSFHIDRNLAVSESDAMKILNDCYHYFDVLDAETKREYDT